MIRKLHLRKILDLFSIPMLTGFQWLYASILLLVRQQLPELIFWN